MDVMQESTAPKFTHNVHDKVVSIDSHQAFTKSDDTVEREKYNADDIIEHVRQQQSESEYIDSEKIDMLLKAVSAGVSNEQSTGGKTMASNENPSNTELPEAHGFFTVVSESTSDDASEETKESQADALLLDKIVKEALDADYSPDVVEKARALATSDTRTLEDFDMLIDEVLKEEDEAIRKKEQRMQRIRRMKQDELLKVKGIEDPVKYLKSLIYKEYNTTAVEVVDLLGRLKDSPELMLDVYEEPVYSIILQINKPFVEDAVNECLAAWVQCGICDEYVNQYLESRGVPRDMWDVKKRQLIEALPTSIQNELSPDCWKAYTAAQILLKQSKQEDAYATDDIFANIDRSVEYSARFENYHEDGVPVDMASTQAVEDTYNEMDDEEQLNLFGKVASFHGKMLKMKYENADTMDRVMRDSLGDYYDVYAENKERRQERKAQLREQGVGAVKNFAANRRKNREEVEDNYVDDEDAEFDEEVARTKKEIDKTEKILAREELKQIQAETKAARKEAKAAAKMNGMQQGYGMNNAYGGYAGAGMNRAGYSGYGGYGNSRYRDTRFGMNNGYGRQGVFGNSRYGYGQNSNFAPRIPTLVIVILIHLVVALLTFIFAGGTSAAFVSVGLIISTFGFVRRQTGEPNSIPMIILGYVIALIVFIYII